MTNALKVILMLFLLINFIYAIRDDEHNIGINPFDAVKDRIDNIIDNIKNIPNKINDKADEIISKIGDKLKSFSQQQLDKILNSKFILDIKNIYEVVVDEAICWRNSGNNLTESLKENLWSCDYGKSTFLSKVYNLLSRIRGVNNLFKFNCQIMKSIDSFFSSCEPTKSLSKVLKQLSSKIPINLFTNDIYDKIATDETLNNLNDGIDMYNDEKQSFIEIDVMSVDDPLNLSQETSITAFNSTTKSILKTIAQGGCSQYNINSLNSLEYYNQLYISKLTQNQLILVSFRYLTKKVKDIINMMMPDIQFNKGDSYVWTMRLISWGSYLIYWISQLLIWVLEFLKNKLNLTMNNLQGCVLTIQTHYLSKHNAEINDIKSYVIVNNALLNQLINNQSIVLSHLNDIKSNLTYLMMK